MSNSMQRRPYASLNPSSRSKKAQKIERLLSTVQTLRNTSVLEIGTGSGVIAAHFVELVQPGGCVYAVDVKDQRKTRNGYEFKLVQDTELPFQDAYFDICISNHVIEHVGDEAAQLNHLKEIRRVLKPQGWLYLAAPNRWALIEPHFRLPFLSWLPLPLADRYVRAVKRGQHYDCRPPSHRKLEALLQEAMYSAKDVSIDGIKLIGELETAPGLRRTLLHHPQLWARPLRGIMPSFLYLARPS